MIDLLKNFFDKSSEDSTENDREERAHDVCIATCALLLEMANIDGEFSEPEKEHIISTLKRDFELSDDHAAAVFEASNEELEGSIDLWQFTNLINQNYSINEKVRIIETVWEVAYRDGKLDRHEDYLMHKLSNLLRLSHKQLIDAKLKVKKSIQMDGKSLS